MKEILKQLDRTLIMGILNVTPDSFYDGGRFFSLEKAVLQGIKMAEEGADIIDIGGESSRPGSLPISEEEELKRVIPVIKALSKEIKVPISIDTTKSKVAEFAISEGATIINDISGLRFDEKMADVACKADVLVVIMHMKGTPFNMQKDIYYEDVISEILSFFKERLLYLEKKSIDPSNIIIDPGIGFGKRVEDNLSIIANLSKFKVLEKPILIGVSRKSFIGKILDLDTQDRLEGTLAANTACILNGANIIRVHDVKEGKRVAKVADAIKKYQINSIY